MICLMNETSRENIWQKQIIPIILTAVVAVILIAALRFEIGLINSFINNDLSTKLRWGDVIIGGTIYLKTAIDFAIFIARLMDNNRGWKNRVAIEIGTAAGNAAGTMVILLIWAFFQEVTWLLAIMIFIAALVLFRLAEEGLEHVTSESLHRYPLIQKMEHGFEQSLIKFNRLTEPVLRYVVPNIKMRQGGPLTFWGLFGFSLLIPFILGLDDFAGYVPLFSIVNVFGFAVGVFLGHMVLNALLFISPERTVKAIKNPAISLVGSIAFAGLGIWGLVEVVRLFLHH